MKASQQHSINYSKVAILGIVAVIIAGIWIFHFDDELFGSLFPKPDLKTPLAKPATTTVENNPNTIIENKPDTKNTVQANEPKMIKTEPILSYKDKLVRSEVTEFSKIEFLESKTFDLDVSGTAYEGSPSLSNPAELHMIIKAKEGTKLEKFDVLDAHILIGYGGLNLDKIQVEIKDKQITISSTNDDPADPYFTFVGTLDESLLTDNDQKQKITFENQLLFLSKKDESTPHHLDLTGTLKSE